MTDQWPTYPAITEASPPPLARWRETVTAPRRQGRPGIYGAALDVWRDGVHLWRSYPLSESEWPDDWSERTWRPTLGDDWPRDHDAGPWGAPGIAAGDWPTPTPAALRHVGAARDVLDLLATVLAIGAMPGPPPDLDVLPGPAALQMRLTRAGGMPATWAVEAGGVTVRALFGRCAPAGRALDAVGVSTPTDTHTARLWRRETIRDVSDPLDRDPETATFEAPVGASANVLIRHAKVALRIPGWPAQREGRTMTWRLTRAPYAVTIGDSD